MNGPPTFHIGDRVVVQLVVGSCRGTVVARTSMVPCLACDIRATQSKLKLPICAVCKSRRLVQAWRLIRAIGRMGRPSDCNYVPVKLDTTTADTDAAEVLRLRQYRRRRTAAGEYIAWRGAEVFPVIFVERDCVISTIADLCRS